ncbi:hypothetical protein [Pseudomonas schmalbachii]|uniref:Uncharacterized protein n=1 Tax=Pseudomonas schmalbachii TaxID=2816993 RepID=A0ABS3TQQ3_9PSED|nr:hypothetical protein [Pseudomonas schmalbachii]MBO3276002.1 hypothetical protein [Pseudomonas schmalbachii]
MEQSGIGVVEIDGVANAAPAFGEGAVDNSAEQLVKNWPFAVTAATSVQGSHGIDDIDVDKAAYWRNTISSFAIIFRQKSPAQKKRRRSCAAQD